MDTHSRKQKQVRRLRMKINLFPFADHAQGMAAHTSPEKTYPLKVGDRVQMTPAGISLYGGVAQWVPASQGGGKPGTLVFAGERPHKPGAAPRPYYVLWDNGVENSYKEDDLMAIVEDASIEPRGHRPAEDAVVTDPADNVILVQWGK